MKVPKFPGEVFLSNLLRERRILAGGCIFLLLSWLTSCVTDLNHPPGVRYIRLLAFTVTFGLGLLEYKKPWWGMIVFLMLWPQESVARVLLEHISPLFTGWPQIAGGPAACALTVGYWGRTERALRLTSPSENRVAKRDNAWTLAFRLGLLLFAIAWTASAIVATVRIANGPSAPWLVQPPYWRGLLSPTGFTVLVPSITLLKVLPPLLFGALLLNTLSDPRFSEIDSQSLHPPVKRLLITCFLAGVLTAIEVSAQMFSGFTWSFNEFPFAGPFNNVNTTGPLLIVMVCAGLCIPVSQKRTKIVIVFVAIWMVLAALVTGSRNVVLMICVTSWLSLFVRSDPRRIAVAMLALLLVLACAFWIPIPKSDQMALRPVERVLASVEAFRSKNWLTLTSSRNALWRVAWEVFKLYPLTGSGPGTFGMLAYPGSTIYPGYQIDDYFFAAHSMPMNTLAELGLPGMAAWTSLWIIMPFWVLLKKTLANRMMLVVLCLGIGNIVDTMWLVPGATLLSVILIVLACADLERQAKTRTENRAETCERLPRQTGN